VLMLRSLALAHAAAHPRHLASSVAPDRAPA
jgi:hypothetical protein